MDNKYVVAFEGLDGVGKTSLIDSVKNILNNSTFIKDRDNNKLTELIKNDELNKYILIDRYWVSGEATKYANHITGKSNIKAKYIWPENLIKPNLFVILSLNEKLRVRYLTNRDGNKLTNEERLLNSDSEYRNYYLEYFSKFQKYNPSIKVIFIDTYDFDYAIQTVVTEIIKM